MPDKVSAWGDTSRPGRRTATFDHLPDVTPVPPVTPATGVNHVARETSASEIASGERPRPKATRARAVREQFLVRVREDRDHRVFLAAWELMRRRHADGLLARGDDRAGILALLVELGLQQDEQGASILKKHLESP